jgi:methoxymalonate biosynthesis acyl carrier protein
MSDHDATENVQTRVRQFVRDHVEHDDFADDDDLFATGLVSSLFAVQIVMWVERTFGATVGPSDLDIDNFATVEAIAGFVRRKRAEVAAR